MATQVTHLFWLYLSVENRIFLKRYEILSEQIVQFDKQYDVYDWFDVIGKIEYLHRAFFFLSTWPDKAVQEAVPLIVTPKR